MIQIDGWRMLTSERNANGVVKCQGSILNEMNVCLYFADCYLLLVLLLVVAVILVLIPDTARTSNV